MLSVAKDFFGVVVGDKLRETEIIARFMQSCSMKDFQNRMLDMVKHKESKKNVGELSI